MKRLILLGLVCTLFCINAALAQTLETYGTSYTIAFNKAVVETNMEFKGEFTGKIVLTAPVDSAGSSVYINEFLTDNTIKDGKLSLDLESAESLKFNYVTKEPIDGSSFIFDIVVPYDSDNVQIRLTLPEGAVLAKPISKTAGSGSVFPKPDEMTTDGRSIILVWERQDLKKGAEFPIYVKYENKSSLLPITLFFIALVAFAVAFIFFIKRKSKTVVKTRVVVQKEGVEEHLKEDEEQVVNILKQRENQCEQGTLRVITGFSKAKVSALLKELEERKVIYKEKRGKKNLVFLKNQ